MMKALGIHQHQTMVTRTYKYSMLVHWVQQTNRWILSANSLWILLNQSYCPWYGTITSWIQIHHALPTPLNPPTFQLRKIRLCFLHHVSCIILYSNHDCVWGLIYDIKGDLIILAAYGTRTQILRVGWQHGTLMLGMCIIRRTNDWFPW